MKKIIFSLLLACVGIIAIAQENGLNPIYKIQINDLEYKVPDKEVTVGSVLGTIANVAAGKVSDIQKKEHIPAVNSKVKNALSNIRRMVALDNPNAELDMIFSGEITNLGVSSTTRLNEYKKSDGKVIKETVIRYEANIAISLTMTSLANGVTKIQNFTAHGYSDYYLSSAESAVKMAIGELGAKIIKFYNTSYPVTGNIIERGDDKKDKQKGLYIDVGSSSKVHRDMHFYVYVIGNVAGRETRKQVGKLIVTEVLGDNISLCKVQSGGKEIKIALDEDKHILAISKD